MLPFFRFSTVTRATTGCLVEMDDLRSIGVVTDLWHRETQYASPARPRLEALLIRLLLRLSPDDGYLLDRRQWRHLCGELSGYNASLVLAVLAGLKEAGGGEAICHVQPLAEGRGLAARNEEVHVAARECLLVLQTRSVSE